MEIIREIGYSAGEGKTQYDDKDNDMVRVFVDMKKGELRKFKRWMKADGIKPPLCDSLPDDKEIEFVASDESNGIDFNDLRYRSVWEEGFIKGAEWMKTRVK